MMVHIWHSIVEHWHWLFLLCWCKLSMNFVHIILNGSGNGHIETGELWFVLERERIFVCVWFRLEIMVYLVALYVSRRGGCVSSAHQWHGNQLLMLALSILFCMFCLHSIRLIRMVLSAVNGFAEIIVSSIQIGFNFRDKLPIKKRYTEWK